MNNTMLNIGTRLNPTVLIIAVLIAIVAAIVGYYMSVSLNNSHELSSQSQKIVDEIDKNSALTKTAMDKIGNASLQRDVATMIAQHINETNAKLDKLMAMQNK